MESEIIKIASTQGIWAVLSASLIFYILKTQEKRDEKLDQKVVNYQDIISKLTEKITVIEDVQKEVEEIKLYILKK